MLQNRYKIIEYIGCGGMAEVYKAIDLLLEREVAVKILHPQFASDEKFIARFHREAQSAARLSYNSIVSVFDVGKENDVYFIVMEYVHGETLQKLIAREAPLEPMRALNIARVIAKALARAHKRGIVHCDIKPHNILMDENSLPKVSDFGIARAVSSSAVTLEGGIMGSVHYLSPEQAQGGHVTYSSDIYSLGVVLFEMLTGKVPFEGETPVAVALHHVQTPAPVLRDFVSNIPPQLESVVLKTLAKQPTDRYRNADDLVNDLDNIETVLEGYEGSDAFADTVLLDIVDVDKTPWQRRIDKIKELWQKRFFKIASVVVLLMFSFLGGHLLFGSFLGGAEVKVPNIVGKEISQAQKMLSTKRLAYDTREESDDKVPPGFVINQFPEAGSIVKEKREITIIVSKGPALVTVPSLVGTNIDQARATLQKAQLKVGRVEEQDTKEKPPGTVLSQNPAPPAQIGEHSPVDLVVVYSGVKTIPMPELRGMQDEEAKNTIAMFKLKLNEVINQYTSSNTGGTVVDQTPSSGQEIKEGGKVTITVTRPLSEQEKHGIVEFIVPTGKKGQDIKVVVTDTRGRRTVYESSNDPGARIRQTVDGVGTVRVQFYSNNQLLEEKLL